MAGKTGTITATGSSNAITLPLSGNNPDVAALVGSSGPTTSATIVVEVRLRGGSIWYPAAMTDMKTGAKSSGSASISDNSVNRWLVDCRGCSDIRVYDSAGSALTHLIEIISGQKSDFDGPVQFNSTNYSDVSTFGAGITFSGATGTNKIAMPDNLADALSISEASTAYMTFITTNGSEAVAIKKGLTFTDLDITLGTTTGTKIGTATTQKIGFYNTTPVVQPSTNGTQATAAAGGTTTCFLNTTLTGGTGSTAYTVGDIVRALKLTGLIAA